MFLAIVPAYNEEKRIGSVVRSLFGHVDRIVVVDDFSSDNTVSEARDAGATVLVHALNRGQGAALETGHAYARKIGATYVVHFDGDGQFDVEDIGPAFKRLKEEGVDVLFGSRFLDDRSNIPWFKKYILLPLGRLLNRILFRLNLSDAHNGFRILNRNALDSIKITQDRMAHASEVPSLVKKHNLAYIEYPVKVTYHEYGQGATSGFRIISDLLLGKFVK